LPLLSFLLDQLWRRRTPEGVLTFAAYHDLGGLEGAIGRRAEEVFRDQPDTARSELVRLLRALVTVTGDTATARSAPLAQFPEGSLAGVLVDAFLDPQVRLRVEEGDKGPSQLRLAHEALLTHWPRARDQVAADARDLELRGRLEQEAKRWQEAPRRDKRGRVLPPGLRLAEARALCVRWGAQLPVQVTEFVAASRRAARRNRRRRIPIIAGAVLALMYAIVWTGLTAWGVRAVEAEMEFVPIPAGCFQMGSPEAEEGRLELEGPVNEVCLKRFELGKFEVTQEEWAWVMVNDSYPSRFDDDRHPVDSVSWDNVWWFILYMNTFGRHHYRLPSEAEWEYAARAGTKTAYYWEELAEDACSYENVGYCGTRNETTWAVGSSLKPNPLGYL
jgi:formylglycine-generating enzyme required for sulfatase activity